MGLLSGLQLLLILQILVSLNSFRRTGAYGYGYGGGFRQRSCQFFRGGVIYRGPCKPKTAIRYEETGPGSSAGDFSYGYEPPRRPNKGYSRPKPSKPINYYPEPKPAPGYNDYSQKCQTNDGLIGICRPPVYCYSQYDDIEQYGLNQCPLEEGVKGICCPVDAIREPYVRNIPIRIPPDIQLRAKVPRLDAKAINRAAEESRKIIRDNLELEAELVRKGFFQRRSSMEALHQSFFGGPDETNRRVAKDGLIGLETTIQIAKRYRLKPHQARDGLQRYSLKQTTAAEHCPRVPRCKISKYRTIDGSCNNLNYPLWGMSHTAFSRLLPPSYADGLNELRKSVDGGDLPTPRQVSRLGAIDRDIPDRKLTLVIMQWGQFIDHDLTLTASTRVDSDEGEGLQCCQEELAQNLKLMHPSCKPIYVEETDPFYSRFRRTCLNFVRNAPSPRHGCTLGPREQSNVLTHYMDGSMVYGSADDRARHLRSFEGGFLRTSLVNNVEFLPFDSENRSDECAIPAEEKRRRNLQCFVGGDVRVNEQTGLTVMHNLLLREHNRVAAKLSKLNPKWDDETIYQEARRIVGAQISHITYNEWTPLVLGRSVMKEFNLMLKPSGYTYDYDPSLNGGILNAFATAAYRFHTLIQGQLRLMNNQGLVKHTLVLRNLFNNPTSIYHPGNFDGYLNALTGQPIQTFDQFFTEEITNHLFEEHGTGFGMDLIGLNIQRGRGYNHFRKICGLKPVTTFQELEYFMYPGSAQVMERLYRDVDDMDLFIAANHEKALPDAIVGPVLACILAEQSRRNKVGDRFWYENGKMTHSFTEEQLNEIRKSSLAALVCDNSDKIEDVQPLAFIQPNKWNPRTPCEKIHRLNLDLWKNEPIHY